MDNPGLMDRKISKDEHMARHSLLFRVIAEEEKRKRRERRRRRFFHDTATAGAHERLIGAHGRHDFLMPDPSAQECDAILAQMRDELEASLDRPAPAEGMGPAASASQARRRPVLPFLRRMRG